MRRPRVFRHRAAIAPIEAVSRHDALDRTLVAIRTMRALPSAKLRGIVSNWPREFEFHGEAIKVAVFAGALDDKKFLRLRAQDFDDIHLGPATDDGGVGPAPPPRADQVSDVIVAGVWFASLARLDCNVGQFDDRLKAYRAGKRPDAFVDDQRILQWHAFGWSLKSIGERVGLNEFQTERRLDEIATSLHRIANGWAKLADIERRISDRAAAQAARGRGAKARF